MQINLDSLPNDPKLLREIIINQTIELAQTKQEIEKLKHYISQLQRSQYGPKSERLEPGQQVFDDFVDVIEDAKAEVAVTQKPKQSTTQHQKKGHGRRMIPKELPRKEIVLDVPESDRKCVACNKNLTEIGEDVSEKLEYKPESYFVNRIHRKKYACKHCQENIVSAKLPPSPIDKGLAGSGLLSHVIISKYCDHLPLYRQEQIFKRNGIEISMSTMCDWIRQTAELLEPIWDCIKRNVLASYVVNTDDTPVPVLDELLKHTRKGRMWIYVADNTIYDYSPTREKKYPEKFFGIGTPNQYKGKIHADAFTGYNAMFKMEGIIEVACWAHARRYFFESKETDMMRAMTMLSMIGLLYKVEEEIKETSKQRMENGGIELTAKEVCEYRQRHAVSIMEQIKSWLEAGVKSVLPKSPIGEAINYTLSQWIALTRYLDDGNLEIDNNKAERGLRMIAVGRKNWMFFGGDTGGRWAAIHYTLIASCKAHGVEPFRYLSDVLERILAHPSEKIHELMPANWKKLFGKQDTS